MISARGMVRRASLISSPMKEADSAPLKAYRMVAHTPSVPRLKYGFMAAAVKWVAEPNFTNATTADRTKQGDGNPDAQRAEIVQPFADVEADDVERQRQPDAEERKCDEVRGACCRALQRPPPT